MRTLLICNNCSIIGHTRVIAELLPKGNIAVRRKVKNNNPSQTIIMGTDFTIYCGDCGKPMYQKKQHTYLQYYNGSISGTLDIRGTSFI